MTPTPTLTPRSSRVVPRHNDPILGPQTIWTRLGTLVAVIVPFLGFVAAVVLLWGWGFHWAELGLLVGMYVVTALGVTVGYHRLFTHRSFETTRAIQFLLGVCGSMAFQGSLLQWVALHRRHHQHSDHEGDPHSPHQHGHGLKGMLRGFWHAHIGWFFHSNPPGMSRYVKDLRRSRLHRRVSGLFLFWVALGLLIPAVLGWLLAGGWMGAVLGLIWGGLVRIFLLHHVTWSVNSVCHLWGQRPHASQDESRNNVVFGILAMGEGWHNNHHAFPRSARHGLEWWQFDLSYYVIRGLELVGLAWNLNLAYSTTAAAA